MEVIRGSSMQIFPVLALILAGSLAGGEAAEFYHQLIFSEDAAVERWDETGEDGRLIIKFYSRKANTDGAATDLNSYDLESIEVWDGNSSRDYSVAKRKWETGSSQRSHRLERNHEVFRALFVDDFFLWKISSLKESLSTVTPGGSNPSPREAKRLEIYITDLEKARDTIAKGAVSASATDGSMTISMTLAPDRTIQSLLIKYGSSDFEKITNDKTNKPPDLP